MKVAIFDVSNGNCALAVCSNGHSMMFDSGSHSEKVCPVEIIKAMRLPQGWLSHMKNYQLVNGQSYPLSTLVISHPDLDHIKNIEKVHSHLTPYLLHRRMIEEFPHEVVHQEDDSYKYYKENVCATYRTHGLAMPDWGFIAKSFMIPMNVLVDDPAFGVSKIKNNSSLVYLLEYNNFRILFCGDMEEVGWDWLIENDLGFCNEMSKGIDVMIASHHGHTSGYSQRLMNLIGSLKLAVLSKGAETGGETDVDSRYSAVAQGCLVNGLTNKNTEIKKTLTTRSNGNIYLDVDVSGTPSVYVDMLA